MEHLKPHAGEEEDAAGEEEKSHGGGSARGIDTNAQRFHAENNNTNTHAARRAGRAPTASPRAAADPSAPSGSGTMHSQNNSNTRTSARRTMSWRRNLPQLGGGGGGASSHRRGPSTDVDNVIGVGRRRRGSTQEFDSRVPGGSGGVAGGGTNAGGKQRNRRAKSATLGDRHVLSDGDGDDGHGDGHPEVRAVGIEDHDYQDVRDELEFSGHNLTSVLNNPRETFMDSLYEAAFETEHHPPLETVIMPTAAPREVTIQVLCWPVRPTCGNV